MNVYQAWINSSVVSLIGFTLALINEDKLSATMYGETFAYGFTGLFFLLLGVIIGCMFGSTLPSVMNNKIKKRGLIK